MNIAINERVPVMVGVHQLKAKILNYILSKGRILMLVKIGIHFFVLVNPDWRPGVVPEAHPIDKELLPKGI